MSLQIFTAVWESEPPFSRLYSILAHDDAAATQRFFY